MHSYLRKLENSVGLNYCLSCRLEGRSFKCPSWVVVGKVDGAVSVFLLRYGYSFFGYDVPSGTILRMTLAVKSTFLSDVASNYEV